MLLRPKAMVIFTKQKERCFTKNNEELFLKTNEERKDQCPKYQIFGYKVERNLNWKGHIKALSSKISRAFGLKNIPKAFYLKIL